MKKNKKEFPFWIIGLIIPIVGFILYFVLKGNNKSKKLLVSSIVSLSVYSLILLAIINTVPERTVDEWYNDINSGKEVITVIGLTTCSHCQEYKPVIQSLSKKYNFNLYFFEVDTLPEKEKDILFNTIELKDYDNHVPFTFIVRSKEYVTGVVGYNGRDSIKEFLKEYEIIKKN